MSCWRASTMGSLTPNRWGGWPRSKRGQRLSECRFSRTGDRPRSPFMALEFGLNAFSLVRWNDSEDKVKQAVFTIRRTLEGVSVLYLSPFVVAT